ncbi:MAG: SLC13 family permease [Candidatus Aminicenantes bacterium]|nr:SLC13 family permease [Candidatus Aminicenantes bacterium]
MENIVNNFSFWYTALLLVLLTIVLVTEYLQTEIAVFSVLMLLVFGGVIDVKEAFAGFSNHGMLTVGFLFVVAGALQRTGVLEQIGDSLLGNSGQIPRKLARLLPPVSAVSAFFNNTPVVAMLIPAICSWSRKHHAPVSKFLIPLSYAAILGGTCTLIGTSTNLVVHGLMLEKGLPGMGFFEISKIGVPLATLGLLFIIFVGHKLLPDRKEPIVELGEHTREFVVVMRVEKEYKHIGETIENAGLRHLQGLFLFQVERGGERKTPVSPHEKIQDHDYLFFTGLPETIIELQKTRGLSLLEKKTFDLQNFDSDDFGAFEAVISPNSPLIGKNVRESKFRSSYDAVIIAVHRSGERIEEKIGDIVLHGGDTLLILGRRDFIRRWYHSRDFYLVSKSVHINSKPRRFSFFSIFVLIGMIGAMASGIVPIIAAAGTAALVLIISKTISTQDAWNSINWEVLLIIASAFGIAKGLDNSGVAHFLAEKIVSSVGSFGILGLLAGVYFLANIYTEVITNNAAAALLVPIVLSVASQAGLDPRPFLIAVTMGASASFATPIGYQTNLMVYGPGGYRFTDFLKMGVFLNVLCGIVVITLIYVFYY